MSNEQDSLKLRIIPATVTQTNDTTSVTDNTVLQNSETSSIKIWKTTTLKEDSVNNFENIDISELTKKYTKNPIGVISELGIKFNEKEINELKLILTDKKELKSFLNLIKENSALKTADILTAMQNVKEYKPKNFFKRVGNVIKTAFTDGIGEAYELAKSETVYYADKLGKNMNEVRTERQDFSSTTVVDISDTMTKQPETKENVMHFVVKENKDGSKLYTEQDVLQARTIIVNNINDADEFTANAAELESIQDTKGNIKYKGSTIINVDEKMIKNKDVKTTMFKVALKSDMTDEYLINTTSNLAQNHHMAAAIETLVTAKDHNGKDRFSAQSVSNESNYLKDKTEVFCNNYNDNVKEISRYNHVNGDDVLSITHTATERPEIKKSIINTLKNTNKTSEQLREAVSKLAEENYKKQDNSRQNYENITNEAKINKSTATTNAETSREETSFNKQKTVTAPIEKSINRYNRLRYNVLEHNNVSERASIDTKKVIQEPTVINGQTYERKEVLRELTKKFGTSAEKVLSAIEKDPAFIDLMKQYNGNQVIINALVEDPYLITKIKKAGGSLSVNEIADIVKLCTDTTSTEVMLEALQNYSPTEAMKITRQSKIFNLKDDTLNILSKASSSATGKKSELENLYLTGGKKTEMIG